METFVAVAVAVAALLFDPFVPGVLVLSSVPGLALGMIPGLTATVGIVRLIPFIFCMDPVPAIAAIVSLSAMAIFAGDTPGPSCASPARRPRRPAPTRPMRWRAAVGSSWRPACRW